MQVGGKLAQVGSRLIGGTAKRLADEFFGAFSALVENADGTGPEAAPAEEAKAPPARGRLLWWAAGAVAVVAAATLLAR